MALIENSILSKNNNYFYREYQALYIFSYQNHILAYIILPTKLKQKELSSNANTCSVICFP